MKQTQQPELTTDSPKILMVTRMTLAIENIERIREALGSALLPSPWGGEGEQPDAADMRDAVEQTIPRIRCIERELRSIEHDLMPLLK